MHVANMHSLTQTCVGMCLYQGVKMDTKHVQLEAGLSDEAVMVCLCVNCQSCGHTENASTHVNA